MNWQKSIRLAAILGSAIVLQGCVAAAFPIVAGGVMAGGGGKDGEDDAAQDAAQAEPAQSPAPPSSPVSTAPAEQPSEPVLEAPAVAVETAPRPTETPVAGPIAGPVAGHAPTPAAPTQSETDPRSNQPLPQGGITLFDPLVTYAASSEFLGNGPRKSALLANATELEGERLQCQGGPATVLIDLDPKDGDLFPIDAGSASPALAQKLIQLRNLGVSIAWISQSASDKESLIRVALFRSGLDQLGNDRILLIRAPDQRKQILREHLGESSCLIAIAGDERSDFHELFDYLLDPSDAVALEPLIGDGWFLIPTPLLSERPQ